MSQLAEQFDEPVEMQLRIQRTAEPGVIMAIAWEGGYMTPGQGWITKFVQWVDLRRQLLEMVNIPRKTLDRAEKRFSEGHIFDMDMITRASQLQQMGFQRQTA
ncbi:hypothetical protein H7849_25875 [Alloacidobacterium dinghuense]|uniref:Uncharacterized protein n=1 Tax=Alloacidobacterium dinghuense TaxID=2763107 RepID=A0A7G8BIJ5_9BACT|nr:hypothetical protein [Alloacidobacterium dinghuense]QNI32365.1 hypothetical protein H7849_25875 [Alloacidobacterium dinghuense]